MSTYQIGFIGLGNMGKLMAINLANAIASQKVQGKKLLVWNRTQKKAIEMVEESNNNAIIAESLEQIASQCDLVFTSLGSDSAVEAVINDLLKYRGSQEKFVICEMSTIYPELTKTLEKRVNNAKSSYFCSALPFGQPPVARSAQLVFAIAGVPEARSIVEPLLVPHVGRCTMDLGQEAYKASTLKLLGNSMILSTVEMLAESMTLAEKTGIQSETVLEWIKLFFPAPSAINYGTKISQMKFEASGGFDLNGGLKDATHIHQLGEQFNCPTHIADVAIKHINSAREANGGKTDKDWASLVAGQRIESGLEPFTRSE